LLKGAFVLKVGLGKESYMKQETEITNGINVNDRDIPKELKAKL
jgi:hypothetical protein